MAFPVGRYVALPPATYWAAVPAAVRAKLHFFNVGVEHEPHPNGFLAVLRSTARPHDFVALKVDIDNSPIELSIVERIADDPSLAILVDELFFEYHFKFDNLNFGWGKKIPHSVDDALKLMTKLRRRGIRAHFWV